MSPEPETPDVTQVAALVPVPLANSLRDMAKARERSVAAEIRLALKSWVDEHADDAERAA